MRKLRSRTARLLNTACQPFSWSQKMRRLFIFTLPLALIVWALWVAYLLVIVVVANLVQGITHFIGAPQRRRQRAKHRYRYY